MRKLTQIVNSVLITVLSSRGMDREKERCMSDVYAGSFSIAVARFVSCYDYDLGRWSVSITRAQVAAPSTCGR
jgi:hypothetical protein